MATVESAWHKIYVRGRVGAESGANKSLFSSSRTFTENFVTLENGEGLEKVSGTLAYPIIANLTKRRVCSGVHMKR